MASSASSHQPKHDVFLSFSGEDTRNGFTSYLYLALRRKGVEAYMDENEVKKGQKLSPSLLKAIEESNISVIIFSMNYACSSWCLQELFKIMELKRLNKQQIVPIFYHVDPSNVRKLTGIFEKAFANHQEKWADKLQLWKDAFAEAGYIKGWHIVGDKSDRSEPEYIEEIVQDIVKNLGHMSLSDSKGLVGIDYHKEQIIRYLFAVDEEETPNKGIGIWGMGGIGKTTLAQAIYDEIRGKFDSCCFLANVTEESTKRDGIISLRDKLLSVILEDEGLRAGTPRIGSTFLSERQRRKKVLVVLDDVSDLEQLEILAVNPDRLGHESRFIITSRDRQVLKIGSVDRIYEVEGLNYPNSLHLFSLYAFKKSHPPDGFLGLTERVLEYAKGVPIVLKVLGSTLYQKCEQQWESALNKLKEHPNPKIHNLLKISFDGLDNTERSIFLDVACFFKGEETKVVAKILSSCYKGVGFGISNLVDKCLINIVEGNNALWMHDLLQEMGWNIVRQESKEPGERSRLWTPKDVSRVLKYDTGTKSIEGIFLDMYGIDHEIQLHQDVFARMHDLRLIKFYYSRFSGKEGESLLSQHDLNSLPGELSYFWWEYCPLKSLPSNFNPEKLVELRLPNSNIEQLCDKDQNLANLRVFDLRNSKNLTKIPDLSRAMNIEEFEVSGCRSLVELPCMVHLKFLENLNFNDCPVTVFPEVPRALKTLNLSGTLIEEVPSSIKCSKELSSLKMSHTRIRNLPITIVQMDSLRNICLSHCPNIIHFPNVPENIRDLILSYTQIEEVPSSISCLKKLAFLDMSGTRIENLPSTIVYMDSLMAMYLCHCPRITQFPNVSRNIKIILLDGTPIEEVPSSITRLTSLFKLSMKDCTNIINLPTSICKLISLTELCLLGCSNLEIFPEIVETMQCLTELAFLKRLTIEVSPILNDHIMHLRKSRNLSAPNGILSHGFRKFHLLTTLDLSGSNIVKIPLSIQQLPNLISLYLKCCKSLVLLPELPQSLQNLNVHDCTSLELVLCSRRFWENSCIIHMLFSNCFDLEQDVVDKIVANAQLRLRSMVEEWIKERSRGIYEIIPDNILDRVVACSEISERFEYQSMGSSITIKLCPDWQSERFLCFAPSVVVDFKNNNEDSVQIICEIQLTTKCGDCQNFTSRWTSPMYYDEPIFFESCNMIIWFGKNMFLKDKHYEEVSFEFYVTAKDDGKRVDHIKVEKCGVHVFYVDAECSLDYSVKCNENFSSGEEEEKPLLRLLESSWGSSACLPCHQDEDRCNPNSMQRNSPIHPYRISIKSSFSDIYSDRSIHQEGMNFHVGHDIPNITKRPRSSGNLSFEDEVDDGDELEQKRLKYFQ